MEDELNQLVNVKQAAIIKNVDETSIRRALADGRLKGVQVGRTWVIRRGDLYAWEPERRGRKRRPRDEGSKGGMVLAVA